MCAGDHPISNYPRKNKSKHVKCILCEGNHPDNYKDCIIYKKLQKRHFPILQKKEIILKTQRQVKPASIQSKTVQSDKFYTSIIGIKSR